MTVYWGEGGNYLKFLQANDLNIDARLRVNGVTAYCVAQAKLGSTMRDSPGYCAFSAGCRFLREIGSPSKSS